MNAQETVVVGTDGSQGARAAVRWAAVEADRRNVTLRIVHAYDEVWGVATELASLGGLETESNHAAAIVSDARLIAGAVAPSVTADAEAVTGDPAATLLEVATSADLVVVGNRGRGGFASLMLGSTSQRVAAHASCPVAVVRGRTMAIGGPVVVGADGSADGARALQMAFEAAAARHTSLVAARAFHFPVQPWTPGLPVITATLQECATVEQDALATLLGPWRDKFSTVHVQTMVSCTDAAGLLVDASRTAQLVVVGSRGHGPFVGTLLGSVCGKLLHHAHCPVLVARG